MEGRSAKPANSARTWARRAAPNRHPLNTTEHRNAKGVTVAGFPKGTSSSCEKALIEPNAGSRVSAYSGRCTKPWCPCGRKQARPTEKNYVSGWCWKAEVLNAAAEYLDLCALPPRGACCRAWPRVKVLGRLLLHRLVFRGYPSRRNAKSIAEAAADARWPERSARVRKTKRARL